MTVDVWDRWKQGFWAWEGATAAYAERVLSNPIVLGPAGAVVTAAMRAKSKASGAMQALWSTIGLPTRRDQELILHKLNTLESRIADLADLGAAPRSR